MKEGYARPHNSFALQLLAEMSPDAKKAFKSNAGDERKYNRMRLVYEEVRMRSANGHLQVGAAGEDDAAQRLQVEILDEKIIDDADKPIKSVSALIKYLSKKKSARS